jgi:nucleoid DNA-binding protein
MSLTKERIIDTIFNRTDLSRKRSSQVVEFLFEAINKDTGIGRGCPH